MAECVTTSELPEMATESSAAKEGNKDAPTSMASSAWPELIGWYLYGLCSYFVQAFLLPILFPLIIAQRASPPSDQLLPPPIYTYVGVACPEKEMMLYQMLITRSIKINTSKFSPLHWTAISWCGGAILAAVSILSYSSFSSSHHRPLLLGAAIATGAFFCLLTGFFKTASLFPLYIAPITIASVVAAALHTSHLGLILRNSHRKAVASSRLTLYSTAAGSLSTAVIAVFTYHMLRRTDQLTSLWVVFMFSGLKWLVGIAYAASANRPESPLRATNSISYSHFLQCLVVVFLSSFSSMAIFMSTILYVVGGICIKPITILVLLIAYFASAAVSLPAVHLLQLLIRADAVRMQLLGFILSAVASGIGFYFKNGRWHWVPILIVALVQSAGAGILSAFGRVMVLDGSPEGKEGVFSAWFEWAKVSGACAGFGVAAVFPGSIRRPLGASFLAVFAGIVVLIFGKNGSDLGGDRGGENDGEEEVEKGWSDVGEGKKGNGGNM